MHYTQLRERKKTRVVALVFTGNPATGHVHVEGPLITDISRQGFLLNSAAFDFSAGEDLDGAGGEVRFEFKDRLGLAKGIHLIDAVRPNENDARALARTAGQPVPDIAALWVAHCQRQQARLRGARQVLDQAVEDGFGTGLPVIP